MPENALAWPWPTSFAMYLLGISSLLVSAALIFVASFWMVKYGGDEFVVDLWAGFADEAKTQPFKQNSLLFLASTSKIMTNLCALMLIDQGRLDPEEAVVEYWPGFGKHGKDKILVKQIFAHTAGVPAWKPRVPWKEMTSWDRAIDVMEDQSLWYEPGSKVCYHAETFGFLAGEIIRRISGLTPGEYLREHIASKIDADIWLGVPESELNGVAGRLSLPIRNDTPPSDVSRMPEVFDCYEGPMWYPPDAITAEFPGANCLATAHALAQIGAIHANHGTFDGHRFLSKATLDFALQEQSYDADAAILDEKVRRGFGLGLDSDEFPCPSEQCLHWGGQGGSLLMMDLASKTCLAYTPNNWIFEGFHEDSRNVALLDAYKAIVSQ
jgi:CubicO group peptidase (beta-lactamase class C family)